MREEKTAFVKQMIEGDERAFDELYHSYSGKLYRMAYFITGNRSDSEDVLQETFVKCFLYRRKLKDPERFESWMYQILVRTAWKTGRKIKKAGEISYEGILEQGEDSGFPMAELIRKDSSDLAKNPLDQILEEETSAELRQAVSQLSMKYRTVILLYYFNELGIREIAQITGTFEGTVKSRLNKARKLLRERLEQRNGRISAAEETRPKLQA
ncbi:MAG: RNA polymerase sigma factor [Lachnospiraceae bacterium]|nr:RNA polymerase sigma factor [Lachnospiraceae bacterium]